MSHVQQEPTPDLNPDAVSALAAVMLAQAQESFYRKATTGENTLSVSPYLSFHLSLSLPLSLSIYLSLSLSLLQNIPL